MAGPSLAFSRTFRVKDNLSPTKSDILKGGYSQAPHPSYCQLTPSNLCAVARESGQIRPQTRGLQNVCDAIALVDIFMSCAIIYACGGIGGRVGRGWRDQHVGFWLNGCLCYW